MNVPCHRSIQSYLYVFSGALRGSVVKCLTRNHGVLGSSCTGSSGFFVGVSLGKTLHNPSLALVKLRKDMNNVSCGRDIDLNAVESVVKHLSINQCFLCCIRNNTFIVGNQQLLILPQIF